MKVTIFLEIGNQTENMVYDRFVGRTDIHLVPIYLVECDARLLVERK